jgi:hypothetical protein
MNVEMLSLRMVVAFLGEKEQRSWWNTSFLSPTGLKYLDYNFPRTSLSAGIHGATEAALALHDERIGRGRVFHLFRLPVEQEEKIHRDLMDVAGHQDLLKLIASKDAAMGALSEVAGDVDASSARGPVRLSLLKKRDRKSIHRQMAAIYLSAFSNGEFAFPYFEEEA